MAKIKTVAMSHMVSSWIILSYFSMVSLHLHFSIRIYASLVFHLKILFQIIKFFH